jgi:hypothetical protein
MMQVLTGADLKRRSQQFYSQTLACSQSPVPRSCTAVSQRRKRSSNDQARAEADDLAEVCYGQLEYKYH